MEPGLKQNESALVCAARDGDKKALQEILRRNWNWLRALVYSVLSDRHDVEDVLQEVCVRVIEKIATLREPERFRPWLAVLAQREAIRYRSRRKASPPILDEESLAAQPDSRIEEFVERLGRDEMCEKVMEAVRAIPEKYRQVFVLAYSDDLTYRQISEILDLPLTTVQIRLVRARRMIHDRVMSGNKVA
ncbi:MAG TPA: RNA polymerase sigma factor [Phycisphaerales bacterium]|nr:RNA polymerase sigma factor [Phycisphaerales bacterium]